MQVNIGTGDTVVLPAYAGMIPTASAKSYLADNGAPRVCGDDPWVGFPSWQPTDVLPAYAGMILNGNKGSRAGRWCSPRMRG